MNIQGVLKLREYPGPLTANAKPKQRLEELVARDQWATDTRARLGELTRKCATSLKVGGATMAIGGVLALAGAWMGSATLAIGGGLGLIATGAVVAAFSRMTSDKLKNQHGKVTAYAGQLAMALQRERQGLEPLSVPSPEESVLRLCRGPRAGLIEQNGYLAMPGVRLRKR